MQGRLPACVQGEGKDNVNIHIDEDEFLAARRHHEHLFDLELDSDTETALIRELIEKERLSKKLARTLETLPGAVIVLDGDGIVREQNSKAPKLLNRPLLGLAWSEIVRRECTPCATLSGDLDLRDGRSLSLSRQPLGDEPGEIRRLLLEKLGT